MQPEDIIQKVSPSSRMAAASLAVGFVLGVLARVFLLPRSLPITNNESGLVGAAIVFSIVETLAYWIKIRRSRRWIVATIEYILNHHHGEYSAEETKAATTIRDMARAGLLADRKARDRAGDVLLQLLSKLVPINKTSALSSSPPARDSRTMIRAQPVMHDAAQSGPSEALVEEDRVPEGQMVMDDLKKDKKVRRIVSSIGMWFNAYSQPTEIDTGCGSKHSLCCGCLAADYLAAQEIRAT